MMWNVIGSALGVALMAAWVGFLALAGAWS